MIIPSLLLTHFAPQKESTYKLLDKEPQLEPIKLCELLVIFNSDTKLILERKEREPVLHVSATN